MAPSGWHAIGQRPTRISGKPRGARLGSRAPYAVSVAVPLITLLYPCTASYGS